MATIAFKKAINSGLTVACDLYERVPKFGLQEGIHNIGAYPRSKSAVGMLIPGHYRREYPL